MMIEFDTPRQDARTANPQTETDRRAVPAGVNAEPKLDPLKPADNGRRARERTYDLIQRLLDDRRRNVRVPVGGLARWRSGDQVGTCRLLNVSPAGAAFSIPLMDVFRIGPRITLDAELEPSLEWCIAEDARVVRRVPRPNARCEVAVVFPPLPGHVV